VIDSTFSDAIVKDKRTTLVVGIGMEGEASISIQLDSAIIPSINVFNFLLHQKM
jgi:hypothetical protein